MNQTLVERAAQLLAHVTYPGYTFRVGLGHGGVYLQGSYIEPCVETGAEEAQYTRKWLLSPYMTDSEIVQTAFKCVLTSAEHRVREHFTYKGKRIFGPHFNIEDLVKISDNAGARTE